MYGQPRRLVTLMSQSLSLKYNSKIPYVQQYICDLPLWTHRVDFAPFNQAEGASTRILDEIARTFNGSAQEQFVQAVWLLYYSMFFDHDSGRFDLTAGDVDSMLTWEYSCFGHDFWDEIHRYAS